MPDEDSTVVARLTRAVTQQDIDAYAELSGDRNPIHVDPHFATSSGFDRPIVHGQLLVGMVAAATTRHWGGRWHESGGLAVKFIAPVLVDEHVTVDLVGRNEPTGGSLDVHGHVAERTVFVGSVHLAAEPEAVR